MIMPSNSPVSEVLTGPVRRRRWAASEKLAIVAETYEPGMTVSLVARRHGPQPIVRLAEACEPRRIDGDRCRGRGCARFGLPFA